jgi:CheY-like chemotaxis protein
MAPTLLLADDSLTIRRVIELTFADENIRVVTVADGGEAIARIAAEPPDIVLADVGMPEKDGYEVAAFVKGDPKLAHIPVLLLTGAFEPVDTPRARAIGCDGVLVKPFEPQLVISRVRELLGGQGAQAAARSLEPEPSPFAPPGIAADDYFDRLDAAIAARSSATRAETARGNHTPVEPSPAPPQWDPQVVTNSGEPIGPAAAPVAPSPPPASAAPAPAAPAAAAAPSPPATSPPAVPAPAAPASSLADAFTALLAAERGRSYSPTHVNATFLPDHVIDEIATRVIARLADESMRKAVLDAAERLVTEEIARIKRAQEPASR